MKVEEVVPLLVLGLALLSRREEVRPTAPAPPEREEERPTVPTPPESSTDIARQILEKASESVWRANPEVAQRVQSAIDQVKARLEELERRQAIPVPVLPPGAKPGPPPPGLTSLPEEVLYYRELTPTCTEICDRSGYVSWVGECAYTLIEMVRTGEIDESHRACEEAAKAAEVGIARGVPEVLPVPVVGVRVVE